MPRIFFPQEGTPARRVGPAVEGFRDAQAALREALGVDAAFLIASEPEWPPGTPLDPETGNPYDPFLEPVNPTTDTEVIVRCSFVHRPLQGIDPAASPIGAGDLGDAALIIPLERYDDVRTATRVRVGVELWDIQQFRYDVALGTERWLAYLERA
jgi:hypothetical protein